MSDDLSRIERAYGCYAEYVRQKEEQDAYDWEHYHKNLAWVRENKEKLRKANEEGKAVYFADDCIGCQYYEEIGPTSYGDWLEDIDDVEHGICHNGKEDNEKCQWKN